MCETGACPQAHVLGRRSQTGAVAFDGVDDCLALPQSASSVLDGSFTVAAWIKGSGFDHAEQVILGDTTGHLRLSVRDKRLFMTLDGAGLRASPEDVCLGTSAGFTHRRSVSGAHGRTFPILEVKAEGGDKAHDLRPRPTVRQRKRPRRSNGPGAGLSLRQQQAE